MDLLNLVARIKLDSSEFEQGMEQTESVATNSLGRLKGIVAGLGITSAVTGFAKQSVAAGMAFDSSMSRVGATLAENAEKEIEYNGKTMTSIEALRDFAQEMGRTTAFSASQSADALNYMALAGYDAEKSIAMLPNVLNLAAAGGMDLATASDMITDAESALHLEGNEVNEMVAQMAKASQKSNTSVSQLGEAILTVGGTANYMSGGTDRLNTVLGVLADNGIKGSEAGTHLRNMLLKLASPTKEGTKWLEQLGVQIFDDTGQMRDFSEIFPDLNTALSSLSDEQKLQALSDIFNARDIAAANALMGTTNERWAELGGLIANAGDAADAMAKTQLDNLQGDLTIMRSALEGLQIAVSDRLTPVLRLGTKAFSGLLSSITDVMNGEGQSLLDAGIEMMGKIGQGFIEGIPTFLENTLPKVLKMSENLRANAGKFVDAGIEFVLNLMQGLMNGLPQLIEYVPQIITNVMGVINDNAPKLLGAGMELIVMLAQGIWNAIPSIIANAGNIVQAIVSVISAMNWLDLGGKIITGIANGIAALGSSLSTALHNIATNGLNAVKNIDWLSLGRSIVDGIVSGILSIGSSIGNAITGIVSGGLEMVRGAFDIHSPSKVFEDQVGQWIPKGVAKGITDNADAVVKAMDDLSNATLDNFDLKSGIDVQGGMVGGNKTVNINVYGAEGQDIRELADIIMERANRAIKEEELVYA